MGHPVFIYTLSPGPGVAVTYNGEEIGMVNTAVSWEDTVDPAGLSCGEEHFEVRRLGHSSCSPLYLQDINCSRDPERN